MAPAVDIRSYDFNNDLTEMAADGSLIDVSNHSCGPGMGWDWTVDLTSPTFLRDLWYGDMSVNTVEDSLFGRQVTQSQEPEPGSCCLGYARAV